MTVISSGKVSIHEDPENYREKEAFGVMEMEMEILDHIPIQATFAANEPTRIAIRQFVPLMDHSSLHEYANSMKRAF